MIEGVQLNRTEAIALICTVLLEHARDSSLKSVSALSALGATLLGRRTVLPDVWSSLPLVHIECLFLDGTKLVTVHNPICSENGLLHEAMYASFIPVPSIDIFPMIADAHVKPGQICSSNNPIELNADRLKVGLVVTNIGDRPIQVGSHYMFTETNKSLVFDRGLAYGCRLDIASGFAVRFEPGDTKTVQLVQISGSKSITGGNSISNGPFDQSKTLEMVERARSRGFSHREQIKLIPIKPSQMSRNEYIDAFGPTTGDQIRLGGTNLIIEIERDNTTYGDECVFGGGKTIREGMGQANGYLEAESLDLVITNAVIIDYTGIYKSDIGIKNGYISSIGKSGNPDIMDITPGMVIGVNTAIIDAKGKIVTAGAVDTHVHFICPQLCKEAIGVGITTLIGGGTGPTSGTSATTCTPGKFHIEAMIQATDCMPLNFGFTGKGNSSSEIGLIDQIKAGAIGLKLHEDYGTTPAAIEACLRVCDDFDVQATIHTDTMNESGFVESSIEAFKDRTIHAYHSEGAGGGHAPDIIRVCGLANVIPSSTNPTRPYTLNTISEHLDMLMVCHHLSSNIPSDIKFAESRIRAETIMAEDVLHDIGAISIISSDALAMGRIGETIIRTWQTAHKMKNERGILRGYADELGEEVPAIDGMCDNFRVKRYISKYTINPAIAHGVGHVVGSIEVGKLADLIVYSPQFFGTKPDVVLKGGIICESQMGDPSASIPTSQPVYSRPMFGATSSCVSKTCLTFVSAVSAPVHDIKKRVCVVKNVRTIGKRDMKLNSFVGKIGVDPETYVVDVDGVVITSECATSLPLTQSEFLF